MSLWAISDLHLTYQSNRDEFDKLGPRGPDDGLILAGDISESVDLISKTFRIAKQNFKHVFWVPGNHELYTLALKPEDEPALRGEAKYMACVRAAQAQGVLTPEDEFMTWIYENEDGMQCGAVICLVFTLYDYSFRPDHVTRERALAWAAEQNIRATDEVLLHPDPYDSRDAWCDRLVDKSELRLEQASESGLPLVIVNHWPLREDTIFIPRVPRFTLWCGTKRTKDWHKRFHAKVVVSGHLHVRRTDWIDGVRFEEVSLGYPRQWQEAKDLGNTVNTLMREILPGPHPPEPGMEPPTAWRLHGNIELEAPQLRPRAATLGSPSSS